jgi:hypothetical protein
MSPVPPVLAVLRHALADPLSAATAKAEVLAARLLREAPALAGRAEDLAADLAAAGRLLDLLAAVSDIGEEAPEQVPLRRLVAPVGGLVGPHDDALLVRVRPLSAAEAIRRVVAFGAARGGRPRVSVRRASGRVEIRFEGLGPPPAVPTERLCLLPRQLPESDELFLARAAALADGGSFHLEVDGSALAATLSWPGGGTAP